MTQRVYAFEEPQRNTFFNVLIMWKITLHYGMFLIPLLADLTLATLLHRRFRCIILN